MILLEKETLRQDRSEIVRELEAAGVVFKGDACRCPFHDDKNPSAGIFQGDDGAWRFKCQTCGKGGDLFDIKALIQGISPADAIRATLRPQNGPIAKRGPKLPVAPRKSITDQEGSPSRGLTLSDIASVREYVTKQTGGRIEAEYEYTHPDTGKVELLLIRAIKGDGKKTFRQITPLDNGQYEMKAPPKPWPVYNRGRIDQAGTVVLVEGEKCVHALHDIGIVATTTPGGAGKSEYCDLTPLAGKKCVLWPDNDEPGRKHMEQVEQQLEQLTPPASVSILDESIGLEAKGDAFDFVEAMRKPFGNDTAKIKAHVLNILATARPCGIFADVNGMIEDTITGRREAVKWPWSAVGGLTKALIPGTVTILCGSPGASKSFMLLECLAWWHKRDYKVAVYELEETRQYHLVRMIAQEAELSGLTDPDWIKANPAQARQAMQEHQGFVETIGRQIWASPVEQPTQTELSQWVEDQAKAGCRIIAIDPITLAQQSQKPWVDDVTFFQAIKQTANRHGASVILVTHPTKQTSGPNLEQLAGSAVYGRACQTALWLESHGGEPKESTVKVGLGSTSYTHNRTLHLLKARNGVGQGLKIAMNFESDSLTLKEFGVIRK